MDILLLTTPAQHTSSNPCVETNPRKLQQWIDGLPTMNVTQTVKSLQSAIEPFNELQLADEERIRLLEIYRRELEALLFDYDEMRLHQLPISAEQRSCVAQDIMWLYLNLANGYKLVVKSHYDRGANPKQDKTLLLCMYRAMELIIAALLYSFRAHESLPPLACLEINQLYLFAESCHAEHLRIRAVKKQESNTVATLYKKFLLLSCMRLQRFNGGELLELFLLLDKFAEYVMLAKHEECEPGPGRNVIDLTEDALPRPWVVGEPIPMAGILRVFDLGPVIQEIDTWLERQGGAQDSLIQAQEVRLVGVLRHELENQHEGSRHDDTNSRLVKVVVGLSSLSRLLSDFELLENTCAVEECAGIEVRSFDSADGASVDSDSWQLFEAQDSRFVLRKAHQENAHGLAVGALLGVIDGCDSPQGPAVKIGIVRESEIDAENVTQITMDLLDGEPIPVSCQTSGHTHNNEFDQNGLYFPRDDRSSQPATLLTERTILNNARTLEVAVNGQSFQVEPYTTINATPTFAQFRFRVLRKEA